jgi:hypothetical protein
MSTILTWAVLVSPNKYFPPAPNFIKHYLVPWVFYWYHSSVRLLSLVLRSSTDPRHFPVVAICPQEIDLGHGRWITLSSFFFYPSFRIDSVFDCFCTNDNPRVTMIPNAPNKRLPHTAIPIRLGSAHYAQCNGRKWGT